MEKLINHVKTLVGVELERANTIHLPYFNSYHEAYAVILEEMQEAENEIDDLKRLMDAMWEHVKSDYDEAVESLLPSMESKAIAAAAELIQCAAMAKKARIKEFKEEK